MLSIIESEWHIKLKRRFRNVVALATLVAIGAPIATVVACGKETESPNWQFTLGLTDPQRVNDQNLNLLNSTMAPVVFENLKALPQVTSVSFNMVSNMDTAANLVVSGTSKGAFISPQVMRNHQRDLDVAFFAARNPMYLDSANPASGLDNNINSTTAKDSVKTNLNALYSDILSNQRTTFNNSYLYDQNTTDLTAYYRSQIYIDNDAARVAWENKNIDAFMQTGILTKSATSESGYLVPEKMIQTQFNLPNFKFTDSKYSQYVTTGASMRDLKQATKGVYFSYAAEQLQKDEKGVIAAIKEYPGLQCLAISDPIINDGFVVYKDTDQTVKDALLTAFQAVVKVRPNLLNDFYYHANYTKATPELLERFYKA